MNTLVCYKIIYEEQDITVKADRSLSFERAEQKLSFYDLNAVEEAVKLAQATGGKACALSAGDHSLDNSKLRKGILSRGPEELYLVKDSSLANIDAYQTAQVLAAAAGKVEYDLILCGEGSGDLYAQQVGIQLGARLGIPVINAVNKIIAGDGKITVERSLEDTVEVLEVPLPAVVCVTSDINEPRLPSMKDILSAGKKPIHEMDLASLGVVVPEPTVEKLSVLAPMEKERMKNIVEGDDKVSELFDKIKNELK